MYLADLVDGLVFGFARTSGLAPHWTVEGEMEIPFASGVRIEGDMPSIADFDRVHVSTRTVRRAEQRRLWILSIALRGTEAPRVAIRRYGSATIT